MDHPDKEAANERRVTRHDPDQLADHSTSPVGSDTDRTNVRCPHCAERIPLEGVESTEKICCPKCNTEFNLLTDVSTAFRRDAVPETLAHFQLLEYLGAGQYGNVWKAIDTQLDRLVALKIPRRSLLEMKETDVFLREARAAAQLAHENIVRVFEVGYHDNVVYIASDFIEGADLRQWLGQRRLTLADAAGLCARLADALHHAHEHGVVHRDLKPANVMMDLAGQPHVMDFGMAKRETGEITITLDGQIIGTPAYMSPEQARGESHRVDGRTDLYSLGVILFELLTGELPFRGQKRMLIVQILSDEPPSPRKLNARVPKDLETICLKCLEKNPDRRYPSGAELAADLRRWLNKQPIEARPVSRLGRVTRWCQRHPAVASLIALILLITAIGFGMVTWQWRQTRTQFLAAEQLRKAAQRQRERGDVYYSALMKVVDKMLLEVGAERLKDEPHSADIRRTLAEEALRYYVWLSQQEAEDDEAKLRLGNTLVEIGKLRHWLGENKEAEESLREALQIVDQLKRSKVDEQQITLLELKGRFLLAELLRDTGRELDAESELTKNLTIARGKNAKNPEHAGYSLEMAKNLIGLGVVQEARSRRDEADQTLKGAIELLNPIERRKDLDPDQLTAVRFALARANHLRGNLLNVTPRFRESDAMYREAVRLHDQITRSDHEHREALASILGDWARYLHYVEDFEGAKALRDRAIALRTQLVEDHPLVPSYRLHMAILHQNIGYVLAMKRRFEESRQSQRQALDLLEELVQDYPDVPRYREVLANTWNMYAYPLSQTDGNEAAQAAWETARRQYLELLEQQPDDPGSHSDLAAILDNLASLHYRNEDYIQCVALAREAIDHEELARKNDMANALYIRQLEAHYRILALGLNRLGDRDGAIEAYELCVNLMSQLVEQDPERVSYISALGGIYNNMAIVALDSADYPRAESFVRKAIEHQEDARSKNPKDTQVLMYLRNHQLQLARILRDTDHPREAVEAYSKAVAFAEQAVTESDDASLRKASVSVVCELSRFLADPRSGQALDLSRSAELVEKAFEANPEVRVIQYTRGFVAIHKSDWDQAIEQLPGLVGDDQLDLDFQGFAAVYAAMAYAKKGDVERANDYLRKAKEITEQVEPAERRDELKTVRQNVEMLLQAKTQSESPDKKEVSLSSDS